jgi:signal peptidase I
MASYIIVIGKSMEPTFHIGDLIVVHKQPTYQVGDAIVYRNLQLKSFVFHRVISEQLGRYTLKGDNNSWIDTYQPSEAEVVGKLWLHVPRGGIAIQKMRSPLVMALMAAALGALLATRWFGRKARGNQPMKDKSVQDWFLSIRQRTQNWLKTANGSASKETANLHQGEFLEGSFFALGLIMLASLVLGIIAFSRPASRIVQDDISYQHLGVFSYLASAPQGVYDANRIQSGDPIFTKLTCMVDINFQYTLIAARAENLTGTYQLSAMISEPVSGWKRVVPLQEEATFSGNTFGTSARLDLCSIHSLTQSLEQGTDFHPGTYMLVVTPNIKINGSVSSRPLQGTFDPGLTFRYDRIQFYLLRNEEQDSPLALTETGILTQARMEANTMLLLGREISIPTLRWLALFGLIASLSGLTLLELRLQKLSRRDQEKFFRIKYDSTMIDVESNALLQSASTIDVRSMDALAKLAERFNTMILHGTEYQRHTYYVQFGGTTYRFVLDAGKTESTVLTEEALPQEGEA